MSRGEYCVNIEPAENARQTCLRTEYGPRARMEQLAFNSVFVRKYYVGCTDRARILRYSGWTCPFSSCSLQERLQSVTSGVVSELAARSSIVRSTSPRYPYGVHVHDLASRRLPTFTHSNHKTVKPLLILFHIRASSPEARTVMTLNFLLVYLGISTPCSPIQFAQNAVRCTEYSVGAKWVQTDFSVPDSQPSSATPVSSSPVLDRPSF
jgi:hypothetical protein